jgi:hypothetical protein
MQYRPLQHLTVFLSHKTQGKRLRFVNCYTSARMLLFILYSLRLWYSAMPDGSDPTLTCHEQPSPLTTPLTTPFATPVSPPPHTQAQLHNSTPLSTQLVVSSLGNNMDTTQDTPKVTEVPSIVSDGRDSISSTITPFSVQPAWSYHKQPGQAFYKSVAWLPTIDLRLKWLHVRSHTL